MQSAFHRQAAAAADKRYLDDCTWSDEGTDKELCTLGDPSGARTILLTGDSHAMSWAPSLHLAGKELGVRIDVRAKSSCPAVPIPTLKTSTGKLNTKCEAYRAS